jgi:acyl-coenzyme A thioesterase PaaI-like protein
METLPGNTMIYDMIRSQLGQSVPFARLAGVEIDSIAGGRASAHLPFRPEGLNHIGTQHAAALFALGETASGAAMAGAFAPILLEIRPVAAEASIRYFGLAKGAVTAEARVEAEPEALIEAVRTEGLVRFPIVVSLRGEDGIEIGEMMVDWHVSKKRT